MKRVTRRCSLPCSVSLALAACGEKTRAAQRRPSIAQQLTLMLDWFPNADHVGIYQALANGDFAQAGLNVHVAGALRPRRRRCSCWRPARSTSRSPTSPRCCSPATRASQLVSVAAIVQKPLTSIVSLGSQAHHDAQRSSAASASATPGSPTSTRTCRRSCAHADVPSRARSRRSTSATTWCRRCCRAGSTRSLGAYWNYEAIQLAQLDKRPQRDPHGPGRRAHLRRARVWSFGTSTLTNHPDLVRRFVQALARGYESVRRDPSAGVRSLLAANPSLNPKLQRATVKATLPAFFPSGRTRASRGAGRTQSQWNAYGQWMLTTT